MNSSRRDNTIAIIGLILGIIAVLFSFIPCLGLLALIPGVIGAILGVISFLQARDGGYPTGMPIAVIIVSAIACLIAVGQLLFLKNLSSEAVEDVKDYADCETLEKDYEIFKGELIEITKEMEKSEDLSVLSKMNKLIKIQTKITMMVKQSEELGCDIHFEDLENELEDELSKKDIDKAVEAVEEAAKEAVQEVNKEGDQ